jgi:hypothetical protein
MSDRKGLGLDENVDEYGDYCKQRDGNFASRRFFVF